MMNMTRRRPPVPSMAPQTQRSAPPPAAAQVTASPAMSNPANLPQIQRRKKFLAEQLMQSQQGDGPDSVVEGLADLGSAAIQGYFLNKVSDQEQAAKAQTNDAFKKALASALQGGDATGLFTDGSYDNLDPGQQAIANALLERQFAGKDKPQRYEVGGNLVDENGSVIYQGPPKAPDMPSGVQEYEYAKQNGFQGSILDYRKAIAEAGRAPAQGPQAPERVRLAQAAGLQPGTPEYQAFLLSGNQGGPDPDAEGKLRKEFDGLPEVRAFNTIAPIFASMVESAGRNTRASDLNLVYGLAKIMDPGSVVREGEQIMVMNTASLPDWLTGQIARVNGGSALEGATRSNIMAEAQSRVGQLKTQVDQRRAQYEGLAKQYSYDPNRIVPSPFQLPSFNQSAGGATGSANDILAKYRKNPQQAPVGGR